MHAGRRNEGREIEAPLLLITREKEGLRVRYSSSSMNGGLATAESYDSLISMIMFTCWTFKVIDNLGGSNGASVLPCVSIPFVVEKRLAAAARDHWENDLYPTWSAHLASGSYPAKREKLEYVPQNLKRETNCAIGMWIEFGKYYGILNERSAKMKWWLKRFYKNWGA